MDVNFQNETVWLTKNQMAELFNGTGVLSRAAYEKFLMKKSWDHESNVQILHVALSDKPVEFYSLKVIIRIWTEAQILLGSLMQQNFG